MEANEAPEKIYMTPFFGEPNNVLLASFSKSHLDYHRDIEYIRTDFFIEKACEWLKDNGGSYWMDDYDLPTNELVKDFRKYMEGE